MRNVFSTIVGAALLAGSVPARAQDGAALLQRAQLIERHERDLRQAEAEYRRLSTDADAEVASAATLQLGELLWRLARTDEARPLLERVRERGGALAARADAVLRGQDPAGQQAQELAARARQAVDVALDQNSQQTNIEDLHWIGPAAVREIVRRLQDARPAAVTHALQLREKSGGYRFFGNQVDGLGAALRPVRLLWQLGGAEAEAWLRQAAADPEPMWRRLIAFGAKDAPDESLRPVVELMLADTDPEGIVPDAMLGAAGRLLPLEQLVPFLADARSVVRERAWSVLLRHSLWIAGPGGVTEASKQAVPLVLPAVGRALASGDPVAARPAFEFLVGLGGANPAGAALLLEWLPKVPAFQGGGTMRGWVLNAPLADIVACARVLGPADASDGRDDRRAYLARHAVDAARADDVPLLLDLVELGYDTMGLRGSTQTLSPQTSSLATVALRLTAGPADLVRLAGLLDRCSDVGSVVRELSKRELPAAAFAAVGARLATRLALVPLRAAGDTTPFVGEQQAALEAQDLFRAVGHAGSADAVPFLRELSRKRSDWIDSIASAARAIHVRNPSADGAQLLCELLVAPELHDPQRNLVFARLAAAGEAGAIPLYPRAYELGLQACTLDDDRSVPVGAANEPTASAIGNRRGAQWLMNWLAPHLGDGSRAAVALHGYDRDHLLAAWRSLLQGREITQVLEDATGDPAGFDPDVLRLLAETAAARADELAADDAQPRTAPAPSRGPIGEHLVRMLAGATPGGDTDAARAYRGAISRLLRHPRLGRYAVVGGQAARWFADDLRAMLPGPNGASALRALVSGSVTVPAGELLLGLQATHERYSYLGALPDEAPAEVVRAVEAFAADGNAQLRELVCEKLGRMLSPDSVPVLLPLLRDSNDKVRAAATAALQQIRLYHEQKAFWGRFQDGIATGREAAAAKLLAQSKPDQPRDQRLLALTSLGTLGAAEALPYLIDWAKDADAEIAAAARAAIDKIQAAGGK